MDLPAPPLAHAAQERIVSSPMSQVANLFWAHGKAQLLHVKISSATRQMQSAPAVADRIVPIYLRFPSAMLRVACGKANSQHAVACPALAQTQRAHAVRTPRVRTAGLRVTAPLQAALGKAPLSTALLCPVISLTIRLVLAAKA